jgi:hypothetical protein
MYLLYIHASYLVWSVYQSFSDFKASQVWREIRFVNNAMICLSFYLTFRDICQYTGINKVLRKNKDWYFKLPLTPSITTLIFLKDADRPIHILPKNFNRCHFFFLGRYYMIVLNLIVFHYIFVCFSVEFCLLNCIL